MKKTKTRWNFWNMFGKSCEKVVQLQTAWGGLVGIIGTSIWATDSATPNQLLLIAILAYVVNKLLGGFYFEESDTYKGKL
jgi:hypothetical protein